MAGGKMKDRIVLGKAEDGALSIDMLKLIDTRLLVQANSGGGKSGTLRLLAERASSSIQTIILDNEGEFATLREKVDMLLVGDGGELPAEPRSAGLLARRLLETKVSAVIDLYDLSLDDRRAFVREFLEKLIALPRTLWRPTLIMFDEAHLYAPEKTGDVESTKAVIALMSQGRKRGYCGILATQRLSKLHKDAAAECNNVLIGRTWLDVDQKRAGDTLGMSGSDPNVLRDLREREFYGFGPAFSVNGVFRMRTDDVATTMPKAGHRFEVAVPPPSSKVRALLAEELANLPQKAEEEAEEIDGLRRENSRLRREMAARPTSVDEKSIERAVAQAQREARAEWEPLLKERDATIRDLHGKLSRISQTVEKETGRDLPKLTPPPAVVSLPPSRPMPTITRSTPSRASSGSVAPVQQRVLNALAELEQLGSRQPQRELVAMLAGYSHLQSKGFVNAMSELRTAGLIDYPNTGTVALTEAGRSAAEYPARPRSPEDVQQRVISLLGGASGRILEPLIAAYPSPLPREEVAKAAGYGHLQSKGFVNSISRLRTLGFVDSPDRGTIVAQPVLFLEEKR
jgi:hypothetical protein